jgi:hypothetical protein
MLVVRDNDGLEKLATRLSILPPLVIFVFVFEMV